MERDSLVYAQIGSEGPKGYRSGDGLPLDIGGKDGSKLYLHTSVFHLKDAPKINMIIKTLSTDENKYSKLEDVIGKILLDTHADGGYTNHTVPSDSSVILSISISRNFEAGDPAIFIYWVENNDIAAQIGSYGEVSKIYWAFYPKNQSLLSDTVTEYLLPTIK